MPATLTSLRVRNLALVESLVLEPKPGFTVLTGETGAGKSVVVGALNLLLGERADRGAIRSGADSCTVEAEFEGADTPEVAALLEEAGAEPCEDGRLLLKRSVAASGPGRQFANGSPCTLALLRALGDRLIDLHGPHDHQSLFSRERQTALLDAFAKAGEQRARFASERAALLRLEAEREEVSGGGEGLAREIELLRHQAGEIDAAGLRPDEEEELVARHKAAASAARILELVAAIGGVVSEDAVSVESRAADAVRAARELVRLDPSAAPVGSAAEAVAAAAVELARELRSYADRFDADPAAAGAVEARLDLIGSLKRKYGADIPAVLAFGARAAERLAELEGRLARAGTLDAEIEAARERVARAGEELGIARREAAGSLQAAVCAALADLGFAKSAFEVRLERLEEPGPHGFELAEFVFAPNPGEEPRPLRAIASSGEISRVMLAIKGVLAAQDRIPLLVFDEIDANVGGEIAGRVAARMKELARGRQVLCITHLPQVAAAAAGHFIVSKETADGRTRTRVEACEGEAREIEIARMLGGSASGTARAHARALLGG